MTTPVLTTDLAPSLGRPTHAPRPLLKRVIHLIRRGHLFLGLFLLPWAVLYGVTAFLFNHPTILSDQPTTTFGRSALAGTPLETPADPRVMAEQVVARLNETRNPTVPYTLAAGEVKFNREFAFATVKADGQTVNVLVDVRNGTGTVRSTPIREPKPVEKAPFATGNAPANGGGRASRGNNAAPRPEANGILLDDPLAERVKASVPVILERTGFPVGEVIVTSVPEVVLPIEADGRIWTTTYNPQTGAVTGTPADAKPETELSWRRFLLRLHTAHGYPSETNSRWAWAVVVDLMAGTMCFWGLSGLVMWWQIKATRKAGAVVLALSAVAASALGFAMHAAMTS
ncbi:MAG: PepSY domain-containing protein [Fimbriiglobus sp.]|nr:PepSY domain-containing protein [Fimbriiglobus sp.]